MNGLALPENATSTGHVFRDSLAGDDLRELAPSPPVVIDVGAGDGFFARSARQVWPAAKIVSFEPAARFNQSFRPIDIGHVVERVALGNENGERTLLLTHGSQSNSFLPFLEHGPLERIHAVVGHETAEVRRLDDIVAECDMPKVGVLKMDVQGWEIEVLKGAEKLIRAARPVIYCEVALQPLYENHPLLEDVDAYLREKCYTRLHLYASPMPDLWGDAIYIPNERVGNEPCTHKPSFPEEQNPIRLNIGAGETVIPGFTAIDRRFGTEAYPLNYPDNSVEEIRCVHMLEHLSFGEVLEALKEWRRVLRPGGRLRISVPDFDKMAELKQRDRNLWRFVVMGGQMDANDFHKSIWDETSLGSWMEQNGFENVQRWESINTDLASEDFSLNLEGTKSADAPSPEDDTIKIRAVIGMPRIGWNDSWQSILDALHPLHIPIETHQGCFWSQNIQNAFSRALKDGIDWLLAFDYDSMVLPVHINRLLEILGTHPEIDAIASFQMRRGVDMPLLSTGKVGVNELEFDGSPYKVQTAHFGCTILRVECLKNIPKPWFIDVPDKDGEYSGTHVDADINFWNKWRAAGHSVYVAPDVRIGHLQLVASEYDEQLQNRHYQIGNWWNMHARQGHSLRHRRNV